MIENATVCFANGESVAVERVKFTDGGWAGVYVDETWVYYPPRHIGRVLSDSDGGDE